MKAKAKYKFWYVLANMLVSDKFWQIFFCINVKNWLSLNARGLIWKLAVCSLVGWTRRNFTIYDVWLASVRWLYEKKKDNVHEICSADALFLWFALKLQKNLVFYLRYATVQCKQRPDYKSSLYLTSLAFIIGKECCSINTDTVRVNICNAIHQHVPAWRPLTLCHTVWPLNHRSHITTCLKRVVHHSNRIKIYLISK